MYPKRKKFYERNETEVLRERVRKLMVQLQDERTKVEIFANSVEMLREQAKESTDDAWRYRILREKHIVVMDEEKGAMYLTERELDNYLGVQPTIQSKLENLFKYCAAQMTSHLNTQLFSDEKQNGQHTREES